VLVNSELVRSILLECAGYNAETWNCTSIEALDLFYQDLGFIDSLFFLVFVKKIENEFNVEFTREEIQSDQFRKLSGIANLLLGKMR